MNRDRVPKQCRWMAGAFLAMIVFTGALAGQTPDANKPVQPETDPIYIIQPNDVLEIFVWREAELTRKVLVRPDGRISFPLVQDLQAAGLTPGTLKTQIEKRLGDFLNAPEVTVIVEAILSYKIFVLGKVQKPGSVNVEKPVTVLQALALAGGFQDFAKDEEITIIRTQGKSHTVFAFNYRDVIKGRKTEQNIVLRSGDVVVIP
jgi:polysaccharide biosynthesis/export protein